MLMTQKLFAYLHKVFVNDPKPFLALRLQYNGGMTWAVQDGVLTTTVSGGSGANLTIDLSGMTLGALVTYLASQPGYTVAYADHSDLSLLSALVLLDGSGDIGQSNGDHLYGYTSLLYAFLEANGVELKDAQAAIVQMLQQMVVQTATGEFLDDFGQRFGILRNQGELDSAYGPRIITEVLRPRGNNVAMEAALTSLLGQSVTVEDITLYGITPPYYDSEIQYNGADRYEEQSKPLYGLFDVTYGYDLENGGDMADYANQVAALVDKFRDAGTHLHTLRLVGGNMLDNFTAPTESSLFFPVRGTYSDTFTAPVDAGVLLACAIAGFTDSLTVPLDGLALSVNYNYQHNSVRSYNGVASYCGGLVLGEVVSQTANLQFGSGDGATKVFQLPAGVNYAQTDMYQSDWSGCQSLIYASRTNLLKYSSQFTVSPWTAGTTVITANAATAPDGTNTGYKSAPTSSSPGWSYPYQLYAFTVNTTYCLSAYLKAGEYTAAKLDAYTAEFGDQYIKVDLTNGNVLAKSSGLVASGVIPAAGGWYRVWMAFTTRATVTNGQVQIGRIEDVASNFNSVKGIYVWGAQLETGQAPTPYLPQNNLFSNSQDFTNAAWTRATGATVTASGAVDPLGGNTAQTIVLAAGSSGVYEKVTNPPVIGSPYTISVWLRADVACTVNLAINGLTNASNNMGIPVNVTTSWQRFSFTLPSAASDTGLYGGIAATKSWGSGTVGLGAATVYAWGGQLEAGPSASTYQPVDNGGVTDGGVSFNKTTGQVTFSLAPASGAKLLYAGA